jgi:hypothetical protein
MGHGAFQIAGIDPMLGAIGGGELGEGARVPERLGQYIELTEPRLRWGRPP